MQFSSEKFYDGKLRADETVREHKLSDLAQVDTCALTDESITFIDTAGADWDESLEPKGESRRNVKEGELILRKAYELQEAGLEPKYMGIITPYAAQVRWLREHSHQDALEIDTVDGFQGREKEAILISLVRSNRTREIGFLADTRRMNVALTRARRKLIVVGDSATLGEHEFYVDMLAYLKLIGGHHTVWEESLIL